MVSLNDTLKSFRQLIHPSCLHSSITGYIEAIEARLHRMEGLLGGLVKDKDPRAEIVRAELDAMAREAEMTGLKLRRSKAYEEINHVCPFLTSYGRDNGSLTPDSSHSQ